MDETSGGAKLSQRELEIARAYGGGASYREIADRLFIAPTTVRTHLSRIYRKLGVSSKIELFRVLEADTADALRLDAGPVPMVLPDKPSIAVLPFENMSGDPEQEFFADGITEDIITALSRVPDLDVVARNSGWAYRNAAVNTREVAKDLGVNCILEGSVRVANNKTRVTAQLIEGASGHHLWAERYDGELSDIFQFQDDITRKIALALQITLTYGELSRLWEGQTKDLRAWEKMVEGRKVFNQMNRNAIISARRLFNEALEVDPNYGGALLQLGLTHWWEARYALNVRVEEALDQGEEIVDRLFDLGNNESAGHYLKGYLAFIRRQFNVAIPEIEQAVALSPNDSWMTGVLGQVYIFAGHPEKGAETLRQAMRLSPYYLDWFAYNLALAYAWSGERLDEAIELAEWYISRLPTDPYGYTNLATVQAYAGLEDEAAATIKLLCKRDPSFSADNLIRSELYKDPENLDRVLTVLRQAGLPDGTSALPAPAPTPVEREAVRAGHDDPSPPQRFVLDEDGSPGLALPDEPSIAVLPFENMSDDPEQEFFADGITEDIIARLSYLRDLLVIARTSSFAYKGRAVRIEDVARELGVGLVLEGSVRKIGNRVRVTAQLIDGSTGGHLWAQRYDRELTDIFAIQDEITQAIVMAMQVELMDGELARSEDGGTRNLDAWEAFHRGILAFLLYTEENNREARQLFEQALHLDQDYLDARVYLAWTYWQEARSGWSADRSKALALCRKHNDEIVAGGAQSANAIQLKAATLLIELRHAEALEAAHVAVQLGPCKIFGYTPSALVHIYSGDVQSGLDLLRTTMRLSP